MSASSGQIPGYLRQRSVPDMSCRIAPVQSSGVYCRGFIRAMVDIFSGCSTKPGQVQWVDEYRAGAARAAHSDAGASTTADPAPSRVAPCRQPGRLGATVGRASREGVGRIPVSRASKDPVTRRPTFVRVSARVSRCSTSPGAGVARVLDDHDDDALRALARSVERAPIRALESAVAMAWQPEGD
jgi:hypothetical protein